MNQKMTHLIAIALLVLGAGGCGSGATDQPNDSPASQPRPPEEVNVTIEGDKVVMPEELESEPIVFTFTNSLDNDLFIVFARLNEGVTPQKLNAAFKKSPDAAFPLITVAGGFTHTKPDESVTVTAQLSAGTYISVDPEAGDALKPAYFEVTGSTGPEVAEPDADASIEAGDFYFEVGDIPAGDAEVLIENTGAQGHEVVISNVSGKKPKDAAFYFAPPPGGKSWVPLDLEPGDYEVVCYFPDPETQKPHAKLGMRSKFTVH